MLNLQDPSLMRERCFINGEWLAGPARIEVIDPATGDVVACVPKLGAAEVRAAIEGAREALPGWRSRTAKERAAILRRWCELVLENKEDLARLMTSEQGKPIEEARGEISYAAAFLEWFAEEGKRVYGETIPAPVQGHRIVVLKEPVGVCAAITPWNFPAAMITRKAGPALAAGCTIRPCASSASPAPRRSGAFSWRKRRRRSRRSRCERTARCRCQRPIR